MDDHRAAASPQVLARIGGLLYLVIILVGGFGEMGVRDKVVVAGDAAATAANLRAHEPLWRYGVAAELFMLTCAITLAVILFVLLRPVGRDLALLALCLNLVSIAVEAAVALYLVVALFLLGDAAYLRAFSPEQLHAMVSLSARAHAQGFGVSLIFFGCFCLVVGYLIYESGFLPRTIGVLMQIAGLSYLVNSFALLVAPGLAARLFPAILVPAFIGEASLCLWLLLRGVNGQPSSRPGR